MERILYSGTKNASSWAFRAWLALKEAQVDFEERVVDIRRPQRFENLNAIGEFSPPAAVPVFVDGGAVIFDSLAIMEYANDLVGGALMPTAPARRARARSFLAWQHTGLSGLCRRLSFESAFYPDKRAMTAEELWQAERFYRVLDAELRATRGPYLAGDVSLADLALVPTVLRLTRHSSNIDDWPHVSAWAQTLMQRPTVHAWLQEAEPLPPVRLADYMP